LFDSTGGCQDEGLEQNRGGGNFGDVSLVDLKAT
jgi:hypothetical protein